MLLAIGSPVVACLQAAKRLRQKCGLRVGVINARFVKPLDTTTTLRVIEECRFVLTIEEGCLAGGFGSAVLEVASDAGLSTAHIRRLGLPDRFIPHAEREEQLTEVGLDVDGIATAALELARAVGLLAREPIVTAWLPDRSFVRMGRPKHRELSTIVGILPQRSERDGGMIRAPRSRSPSQ
jgi:1-deoxy-D-xylulose-5-phosphate synthase